MTNAPTTRETADHAELAGRLRRVKYVREGRDDRDYVCDLDCDADDYGAQAVPLNPDGAAAAIALENLLSEIAALRGERDRWHSAYEIAHDQATANGSAARQAERQRDEAVGLLREFHTRILMERRCNSLGANVAEPIMEKTRAFLANQGADQ